jgi:hypothetical protein
MSAWLSLAVPRTPPSDAEFDLDGRLKAVDVGAIEQSDFQ